MNSSSATDAAMIDMVHAATLEIRSGPMNAPFHSADLGERCSPFRIHQRHALRSLALDRSACCRESLSPRSSTPRAPLPSHWWHPQHPAGPSPQPLASAHPPPPSCLSLALPLPPSRRRVVLPIRVVCSLAKPATPPSPHLLSRSHPLACLCPGPPGPLANRRMHYFKSTWCIGGVTCHQRTCGKLNS